jgi:predicted nucleic-acid-binding Zn-ribbon protein
MTQKTPCLNCGGNDHFTKEISAGGGIGTNLLPLGFVGWAEGARYKLRVCGNCGLTQWFVVESFLDQVREKFSPEPGNL